MNSKDVIKVSTKKLGKLTTSYKGLLKIAKTLKKNFGNQKNFMNKDYLVETSIITYYSKNGKKMRTIGRDLKS